MNSKKAIVLVLILFSIVLLGGTMLGLFLHGSSDTEKTDLSSTSSFLSSFGWNIVCLYDISDPAGADKVASACMFASQCKWSSSLVILNRLDPTDFLLDLTLKSVDLVMSNYSKSDLASALSSSTIVASKNALSHFGFVSRASVGQIVCADCDYASNRDFFLLGPVTNTLSNFTSADMIYIDDVAPSEMRFLFVLADYTSFFFQGPPVTGGMYYVRSIIDQHHRIYPNSFIDILPILKLTKEAREFADSVYQTSYSKIIDLEKDIPIVKFPPDVADRPNYLPVDDFSTVLYFLDGQRSYDVIYVRVLSSSPSHLGYAAEMTRIRPSIGHKSVLLGYDQRPGFPPIVDLRAAGVIVVGQSLTEVHSSMYEITTDGKLSFSVERSIEALGKAVVPPVVPSGSGEVIVPKNFRSSFIIPDEPVFCVLGSYQPRYDPLEQLVRQFLILKKEFTKARLILILGNSHLLPTDLLDIFSDAGNSIFLKKPVPHAEALNMYATVCDFGIRGIYLEDGAPLLDLETTISTKILEMSSQGSLVIVNDFPIHRAILGPQYPLYWEPSIETSLLEIVHVVAENPEIFELASKLSSRFALVFSWPNVLPILSQLVTYVKEHSRRGMEHCMEYEGIERGGPCARSCYGNECYFIVTDRRSPLSIKNFNSISTYYVSGMERLNMVVKQGLSRSWEPGSLDETVIVISRFDSDDKAKDTMTIVNEVLTLDICLKDHVACVVLNEPDARTTHYLTRFSPTGPVRLPINLMRNIGAELVNTRFMIQLDIDFVNSAGFGAVARTSINAINKVAPFGALAVPVFEGLDCVSLEKSFFLPKTRAELLRYWSRKQVVPWRCYNCKSPGTDDQIDPDCIYRADWPAGHSQIDYEKWMTFEGSHYMIETPIITKDNCTKAHFEPYLIVRNDPYHLPRAPERMRIGHPDKVALSRRLWIVGYKMFVLRNAFSIHIPHPRKLYDDDHPVDFDFNKRAATDLCKDFDPMSGAAAFGLRF